MEQGTIEWKEARCGFFSSSENWKLIGTGKKNPFTEVGMTYIKNKLGEKITGIPIESQDSKATLWGKTYEPMAREWYCKKYGMVVDEVGFMTHPTIKNFGGSPDGLTYKVGSGNDAGNLEIKCPMVYANHIDHLRIKSAEYFKAEFPDKYWQCVSNMVVCGLTYTDFVSFDPRMNSKMGLFVFRLEPSAEDASLLIERIELANAQLDKLAEEIGYQQ